MDHKWDTLLINTFYLENLPRKKLKTDSKHGSQVGYTG